MPKNARNTFGRLAPGLASSPNPLAAMRADFKMREGKGRRGGAYFKGREDRGGAYL